MSTAPNTPSTHELLRFRTGAAMLARLGSEQLRDEITAVIELVKNAYDADATTVRIDLRETGGAQTLRLQDDGSGMTKEDLHSKWAFLATENKVRDDRSPTLRRKRLGQKGVGRFAAEKLGRDLVLRTRTSSTEPLLVVKFVWDELVGHRELSEYGFPINTRRPDGFDPPHGTTLEIRRLRLPWSRLRMEKLRAQLASLIDPDAAADFKIILVTPWPELNGAIRNPLVGSETHRLEFEITAEGRETLATQAHGITAKSVMNAAPPQFGPVRGIIRYFGSGLRPSERSRGGDPEADWNMGIRIFRDGCRVRPYGEPGPEGDWLQIYRSRYLRGSRFRLKPHYLEGSVHISRDTNPNLRDTTSREGLEASEAYAAFVEYVQAKVASLSDSIREEELREERAQTQERYKRALEPLTAGLGSVRSDEYRLAVEHVDRRVREEVRLMPTAPDVRNAHWECLDCGDSWKVPIGVEPTRCREFSVGRDGRPTYKPGCGSPSIRRKENTARSSNPDPSNQSHIEDVIGGAPAYVSGIQLKPMIDWAMGENDEEAEVRPERRELAINGRHAAFRAANALDGGQAAEGADLDSLRAVGALTVHAISAASQAWGRWHFERSGRQFDVYLSRSAELKAACIEKLPQGSAVHAPA